MAYGGIWCTCDMITWEKRDTGYRIQVWYNIYISSISQYEASYIDEEAREMYLNSVE